MTDRERERPVVTSFDLIVLGAGPAGQKAAVQGAKLGKRVLLIERETAPGGSCVHHGTIPSKTLRETAVSFDHLRRRVADLFEVRPPDQVKVESLLRNLDQVVRTHERLIGAQLARNGVTYLRGRARFVSDHEIDVVPVKGAAQRARGEVVVIATGSRPRKPPEVAIDHDSILDSDSILSIAYLPETLTVLGAGVVASEYASIFACLGVQVTMIDKGDRPLPFLDPELTSRFVAAFESHPGCRFLGGRKTTSVAWDGASAVVTTLDDGGEIRSEKLLCTLGRVANLEELNLAAAGVKTTERGFLAVDANLRTSVAHIYGAGDVIGPPALASWSMEQGRRAVRHAFGLATGHVTDWSPVGIFTIPEMSSVGLSEADAVKRFGGAIVGRARSEEIARGQIGGSTDGFLKLISDPSGSRVVGIQIIGEGATELIHVGQMALIAGSDVDLFIENVFNFPTLAEAYRVAALDIARQRPATVAAAEPVPAAR